MAENKKSIPDEWKSGSCEDCVHFMEEEDLNRDEFERVLNDPEGDGMCNYYGYPVAYNSTCWRYILDPEADNELVYEGNED